MSTAKRPMSLRHGNRTLASAITPLAERAGVSAVALACITAGSTIAANAQTAAPSQAAAPEPAAAAQGQTELPKLTVETTAKPKEKTTKPKAVAKQKPQPNPAPQPAAADAAAPTTASGPTTPGGNPYADPNAPYKVDSSANAKLTEPLLDTPRTVTTVSKEVLQDKQVTSLRELARQTPGVTLGTGEGGNAFGDVFFIRGFRATSDSYIDGVRDPSVSVRENFMTEQVEIVKGPSGSIAGRGATGGAVNLVTKKPQDENFAIGTVTLGTDATKRTTVDSNYAIDKTFAVRINGMWQEADIAGRDEVFDNRWGGAIAATWKPTDAFKLTADYYHLHLDQMPDWGVPWNPIAGKPASETGVHRNTFYGVADRDFQKGNQDIYTLTAEVKLAPGTVLTNKLRKGRTQFGYVVSAPETTNAQLAVILANPDSPELWSVTSAPKSRYQLNEIVANQTDITAQFNTGWAKHTLVFGVEVSQEDITRDNYSGLDTESFNVANISGCAVSYLNPDTSGCWDSTDTIVRAGNPTYIDVTSKSTYILDTVKLSPQLIVNAGIRIDDYDIELNSATLSLQRHDTMFNWNGGITWKPLPNGSIYAAIGTSTNPVGQEFDATGDDYGGFTVRSQGLAPEKNTAIEFGTKWELFDRNLLVTAAAFQTTKANAREVVGGGAAAQLLDTGEYRIRGIEFGLAGNVTSALSLYGGAVFMDSEITKSAVAANLGKDFANIAHTTFNLLAKYKITEKFTIGGQATYAGEIQGGTFAATTGNVLPSHWRFDALAEYEISKHIDLQLNVVNVTDELYYDAFYRSARPYVYVAPGRAGYLTVRFKY